MNETIVKGSASAIGTGFITIGMTMVQSPDAKTMYTGLALCAMGLLSIFGREILKPYFDSKREEKK